MFHSTDDPSQDPRIVYADIIDLPHHQSSVHPHMSLHDRAAQFAPFAALTGYDDMVSEEARLTDDRIELSESDLADLDREIARISDAIEKGIHPEVTITYFVPDPLKSGGAYQTITDQVKSIDTINRRIILKKTGGIAGLHMTINIDQILDLH